jgi:hypothetical protein
VVMLSAGFWRRRFARRAAEVEPAVTLRAEE